MAAAGLQPGRRRCNKMRQSPLSALLQAYPSVRQAKAASCFKGWRPLEIQKERRCCFHGSRAAGVAKTCRSPETTAVGSSHSPHSAAGRHQVLQGPGSRRGGEQLGDATTQISSAADAAFGAATRTAAELQWNSWWLPPPSAAIQHSPATRSCDAALGAAMERPPVAPLHCSARRHLSKLRCSACCCNGALVGCPGAAVQHSPVTPGIAMER